MAWRATFRGTVRWNKKRNPAIAVGRKVTLYVPSPDSVPPVCDFQHQSRDCSEPQSGSGGFGGGGGGGSAATECYRCGKIGHIARACPEAPGGGSSGGYGGGGGAAGGYGGGGGGFGGGSNQKTWCVNVLAPPVRLSNDVRDDSYTCGGVGHLSRDCGQGSKCYNCSGIVGVSASLLELCCDTSVERRVTSAAIARNPRGVLATRVDRKGK